MNGEIIRQCEEMMKRGSSSFYRAFAGLPSPRREAVHVIYAFCRLIDDSVDEPENAPYTIGELRRLFTDLDTAEGHFIWPALRWLFNSFPQIGRDPFLLQMEGQLRDLTFTHYRTLDELESYCYLVAGTVGEMLLPVLRDDRSEAAVSAGISLGIGMQIVNIMRDVGEDLERGRRYLPLELLEKYGYGAEELERGVVDERFIALMRELRSHAHRWFRLGLAEVDSYPPESAMAVELAGAFYAAILDVIEDAGYDVFAGRAIVGDEAKLRMFRKIAGRYAASEAGRWPVTG
ncbi:phytoene/squalene synthase family protein [Paenibacillus spiritus]|uniref:Phytoene/squalene synthase family protein n=1 Tax=Paenibacillus spiritus TaxID=2496557 RepID=A0A5J5FXR4_9BACL|nr:MULTISPECIES: phytoene/squalene synthase family protein [Paenibacillus]KAA8998386.1 phytoene/squalene synthase family protein [Paenibacillus spiritus]